MLALDEVADHAGLERARPEQRHQRDDVFERVGLQTPDQVLHAARFQLEHRGGPRLLHELEGVGVAHRQLRDVERRLAFLLAQRVDELHRAIDDRQRAQTQEVELHEARGLDVVLVELRDDAAALVVRVQRRELRQPRRRDHDATRVHAGVARQALERAREVEEVLDLLVVLVEPLELGFLLDRVVERDAELEGNQLRDLVDVAVAHAEHATAVAHDGLRGHRAVGDDLRDALAAVLLRDVLDDAVAAVHAEVDVEVGHRHAFGIQESFEQQVVLQRIDVGDPEAERDERSRAGAAAGTDRHAVAARPADEVRDDQEVAREAHLHDDVELAVEPRAVLVETRALRVVERRDARFEAQRATPRG